MRDAALVDQRVDGDARGDREPERDAARVGAAKPAQVQFELRKPRVSAEVLALLEKLRKRSGVMGLQLQRVFGENPVQFTIIFQWEAKNAP